MKNIHSHKAVPDEPIQIFVIDEPGHGGACHKYHVSSNEGGRLVPLNVHFQNGPIAEHGVNGITQEVLLAIVKDRLEGFQSGAYANDDNQIALDHVNAALTALKARTLARIARGVEGKSIK